MATPFTPPRWFLPAVLLGTTVMGAIGVWLVWEAPRPSDELPIIESYEVVDLLQGSLLHTALQSIAATVALITASAAFAHSRLLRHQTTAIVGSALMLAGLIDVFHLAILDHFLSRVEDLRQFGPFTWALSRIFHAAIVALGTGAFTVGPSMLPGPIQRNGWYSLGALLLIGLGTFSIIEFCAHQPDLPDALRPTAMIPRPFDAIALMLYLLAGGVLLPRFYRRHPSLFSYGLLLSLVPHMLGECFAAFGSRAPYDAAFGTAQLLKLVGYLVPLVGLLVDYARVYRAEGQLRATQEKLRLAREIQCGLLPITAPHCGAYDIAGLCLPTDAVGGDFFDYVPMADQRWGIVIADVSGHDLGAAILMSQARAYLRAEAASSRDPGAVLERVNRFLCRDVRDRRFISLMLAMLDPERAEIRYAAAGHGGFVLRADGSVQELPPTGPVLGVVESVYELGPTVTLEPGDTFALVTDGWPEAQNLNGEHFGNRRVWDVLQLTATLPPAASLEALRARVFEFRQQTPPEDDLTAVLVRRPDPQGAPRAEPLDATADHSVVATPAVV